MTDTSTESKTGPLFGDNAIEEHRLSSGLPVLIKRVANKVVSLDMWVNTGSANEYGKINGISHFLEHMLFKGTPTYGPGELDLMITAVGGVWNAGTSKDFTHYYVTVAGPYFDKALAAISDMIQNSLIDKAEFDKEKQVILEEYRRKQDNPTGLLFDELYDTAYNSGPYKQSVLGSFQSISDLDRDDMFAYYRRYYTAENMILMVVGDVDPKEVLPKLDAAFQAVPHTVSSDRLNESVSYDENFAFGARNEIDSEFNETYIAMAYPGPAMSECKDIFALDVAMTILADGRSSRLYRKIKEEKRLVNTVSAGFPTHRYKSMCYTFATVDADKLEAAESAIKEELKNLISHPPTQAELDKARLILKNSFLFGMETNTGQSGVYGYYYTLTGSHDFLNSYLENLMAVSADDIVKAAKKYFTTDPAVVILHPKKNEVLEENR